ncbi:MAG: short-chain dehydrogenase [Verrucomicrobia bacterium]|nr:MAG: short-chain dehydrogenase [Verrucomicrobiota bacterium]
MSKTAVVTGAGSGVGQAIALALVEQNWDVALVGRRESMLRETSQLAGDFRQHFMICPCDISDLSEVRGMAERVLAEFKGIEVLVNAAGTNAPKRALEVLSLDDYLVMLNTNLHGAYFCVQAFLPQMRARKSGTIINIVSDAGKQASPKAGPAYVMSKFGLAGLTQSINAEERGNGIRACAIFPGDIDTPLLEKRPNPPTAEARARMLQSADVAECALLAIHLPPRAIVEEILIRPR